MKNNNFNPHKVRSYSIVFGLLIFSFLLVFGGLIFRSKLHPDYPLVFTDANNKLMFITKSNRSKNDIASITNASIVYANNNTKYLLYTNNSSLYLLDTTIGGVGNKISNNVSAYGFSEDDKYIYYIDNNKEFYLYNRNNAEIIKISDNVNKVELIRDNIIIYNKNGKLIYYKLDNNSYTISDSYINVELSSDNKLLLYSVFNDDLKDYYVYDTSINKSEKVLSGITKLYSKDNNYTRFIYTSPATTNNDFSNALKDEYAAADKNFTSYKYEDYASKKVTKAQYEANQLQEKDVEFRNELRSYIKNYGKFGNDLYYKNNDTTTLIAQNINDLYFYDIRTQTYSYTTYSFENNVINISDYSNENIDKFYSDFENLKLNSMYFKSGNNSPSMAYKNITTTAKVKVRNNNDYYLLVEDNNYYNLYYSKINNRSIKLVGEIDTNLLSSKMILDYTEGYLYVNEINNHKYLNSVNEGRVRTIAEDVNPNYVAVSESKDSIYYLKTTGDYVNDLNLYNGIRTSKIASDIYSFMYINNDLIYVTKNYNDATKTSDLYRLDGNRLDLIYKNIADWYSPLKEDIEDEKNGEEI